MSFLHIPWGLHACFIVPWRQFSYSCIFRWLLMMSSTRQVIEQSVFSVSQEWAFEYQWTSTVILLPPTLQSLTVPLSNLPNFNNLHASVVRKKAQLIDRSLEILIHGISLRVVSTLMALGGEELCPLPHYANPLYQLKIKVNYREYMLWF